MKCPLVGGGFKAHGMYVHTRNLSEKKKLSRYVYADTGRCKAWLQVEYTLRVVAHAGRQE